MTRTHRPGATHSGPRAILLAILLALPIGVPALAQGGATPPVVDLACDPIAGTTDIAVAWVNPVAYDAVRVTVDGAPYATLPGSATFFTVTGLSAGPHTICVVGVVAGVPSPPSCCDGSLPGGGPGSIGCDPIGGTGNVAIAWPGGPYTSIDVIVDGVVVATLPGGATFFEVLGLPPGPHVICIQAHAGGITFPPVCCTIVVPGMPAPIFDLSCDWLFGTGDVAVVWSNGSAYSGINVYVDGAPYASLPGSATGFTVTGLGPGVHEICLQAITPMGPLPVVCCTITIGPIGGGGFVRGDCNVDATYNLGDVIALLDYLFIGAFAPSCLDACDASDDGVINLGDAIYVLTNLFTLGPPPPPPHPACGPDPTADPIGCVSYPPCP